ncbi:DegT/DnrJ/EryC1/StrS family aminotransferase [Alphaproteobacteria bacterium]|nr:DegT/DnrJ/EryC1/StrS family aminotransferase [Alphaproteobacteria bacterium]
MIEGKLAILGGPKIINYEFDSYNPIGLEEINAAKKVLESGVLSKFLGSHGKEFYGGPKVREFENLAADYFNVKHAVTFNSWTSGLIAGIGAFDIEPGDEVIVTPWTMCASATAIINWNAIPVFADIEPNTFCIAPSSVEKLITNKTKAIMSVDLFGQSADIEALMRIAKKYNLKVLSDSAQAPGSKVNGKFTGTIADIGGYSLNYHKHIHTGEGGVLVTNNDLLAERSRLIRNHAEAVIGKHELDNLSNMIGYNFRMGEIEAAIGIEQLKKLEILVNKRSKAAEALSKGLKNLNGLQTPVIRNNCTHVYYIYPIILDLKFLNVKREKIFNALVAEGIPGLRQGYTNLHLLPMYQQKQAYGSKNFPWSLSENNINYSKGICPNAENLQDNTFLGIEMCLNDYSENDIQLMIKAFKKVWDNIDNLK